MIEASDTAYAEAQRLIAVAKASGDTFLRFDTQKTRALTHLPPEIAGLTALSTLDLDNTQIADLKPIAGLTALTELSLSKTQITDLSPIAGLTTLKLLDLESTEIIDLRPIAGLTALTELYLERSIVSDLSPIAGLTALTMLSLESTPVTDVAPIAGLTRLEGLDLDKSGVLDLRPLSVLRGVMDSPIRYRSVREYADGIPVFVQNTGLSFWNSAAALADERIADIARILNPALRAQTLFDYLKDWVPPAAAAVNEPAEDNFLPVHLVNGQFEISANFPSEEERENQASQILHERLLAKAKTLADTAGNNFPDLATRARVLLARLDKPFESLNLFALHLELEDLEDRRKVGIEDDQPYSEKVKLALADVTRLGPGLTIGHPQVELLLERRRKAREEPFLVVEQTAHDNLSASVVADTDANGPNIRMTEADVQAIADRVTAQTIQRPLHRNYVIEIALGCIAAYGPLGVARDVIVSHFTPEIWAFLSANWGTINEVALTYGATFFKWFTHATEPITQALSTMATIEPRPINRKK